MMREAAIIQDGEIANVIIIPAGKAGDKMLSDTCVDITELETKPGIGNGWKFADGAFIPPSVSWNDVREHRDSLLASSDWSQMPDNALAAPAIAAWAAYRQQLRDIPQTFDDPDAVVWPEAP